MCMGGGGNYFNKLKYVVLWRGVWKILIALQVSELTNIKIYCMGWPKLIGYIGI